MYKTVFNGNGRCVVFMVGEITSVPHYELINKDLETAKAMNQEFFNQIFAGLFREAEPESTSFEIVFRSVAVSNQTYSAQVKMFFIIRKIAADELSAASYVEKTASDLSTSFGRQNYSLHFFDNEEEYSEFFELLNDQPDSCMAAVAKKESIMNIMGGSEFIYFNGVIEKSKYINTSLITDAMTQYPGSCVCLEVIPTSYTAAEKAVLSQTQVMMGYYAGEKRRMQGLMPLDSGTQTVYDAVEYYVSAFNEINVYYNFVVYAKPMCINAICNKLISNIQDESSGKTDALETVHIDNYLSMRDNFPVLPWAMSNLLIYGERNNTFWGSDRAPEIFRRLKYMMTLDELRCVFKFPFDDGYSIGLESNKITVNREKLGSGIISEGNFKIGIIQNASSGANGEPVHAGIPLNDFTKHGLIVGTPGSGKTNFSLGFLYQMWHDFGIPFIAVEPTKSEYRSLIDAIEELQVFTPGKSGLSPFIINPFIPPANVTVETYVPSLMTAFKAAFTMPDPLPSIFLATINECYNEYGWRSNSTKDDPEIELFGMYEFIKVFKRRIKSMGYKGDVAANMESAGVVRLVSLIEQNGLIYDTINTMSIEDMLKRPTVIELNAINGKEQKSLIMALLLTLICVHTKNNIPGNGKLKSILLIDEAHVLLGASGNETSDTQRTVIETIEDMIAEIRSYGTSIIIADQSPEKVGRNIVANTNVKVIFRLVERENKDIIRNATNMTDADYERLGRLGVGEAMLHYGRVYEPLHIKTYNVNDKVKMRSVIPDAEIASLSHYWDDKQKLLIPHKECGYNYCCKEACDHARARDAEFIASRLVNIYRSKVDDVRDFSKLIVSLEKPIINIAQESVRYEIDDKLVNCTKIKFIRKFLIEKSLEISRRDYVHILKHPNFLRHEQKEDM